MSDATKDLSISALTCAGNVTLNGNTTIGNASSDTLTVTGSLASHLNPSAHNTYDFGTVTSLGFRAFYFASSSATKTAKLIGPATSSDIIITLPAITGTLAVNTVPSVQTFTSGSGTYTTPSNCRWIRIKMVGGGGGGSGSGTVSGGNGGTGGNTTFGTNTAAGGSGGTFSSDGGGGGSNTFSLGSGVSIHGADGMGCSVATPSGTTVQINGGSGGCSPYFSGGAQAAGRATASSAGQTNTGGGGQGGYCGSTSASYTGSGGGSGGFIEAIVTSPSATYSYAVGAAGSAGTAGTNGVAGGAGGSGMIIVEEYYY